MQTKLFGIIKFSVNTLVQNLYICKFNLVQIYGFCGDFQMNIIHHFQFHIFIISVVRLFNARHTNPTKNLFTNQFDEIFYGTLLHSSWCVRASLLGQNISYCMRDGQFHWQLFYFDKKRFSNDTKIKKNKELKKPVTRIDLSSCDDQYLNGLRLGPWWKYSWYYVYDKCSVTLFRMYRKIPLFISLKLRIYVTNSCHASTYSRIYTTL